MNRENKRKQYDPHYFQTHPCSDSFTCKVCGRLVTPDNAGSNHRNHCPNCLSSLHIDDTPGDRASDCGVIMKAANGRLSTGAADAACCIPTGLRRTIIP